MGIEKDKETLNRFLSETVNLLLGLLEKGYTLSDISAKTGCEMGLLVALARLLGKQRHSVAQYEKTMTSNELQVYGGYMDILEPLVKETVLKMDELSMKKCVNSGTTANDYRYSGSTIAFTDDNAQIDIHVELILSDLKCYREEIMNYLDTLFSMDITPVRTEIIYCYDKLKYVDKTTVFVNAAPKELGERRLIYNDLQRHRYEIRNKRTMSVLENTDEAMRLKSDSEWLAQFQINESIPAEEIPVSVARLSRLAQLEAFRGDSVYIGQCLEDIRLLDSVRQMQDAGEDSEGMNALELRWTMAKHRRTRLSKNHNSIQVFVNCLADLFSVENPRLLAVEQQLEELDAEIARCEEEVQERGLKSESVS